MSFPTIRRGGPYLRVADPDWDDPLAGRYAHRDGGRWNPPRSFPVVYLNADLATARANVHRRFRGRPFDVEDLASEEAPVLVATQVPEDEYVDIVTDRGCVAAGLLDTYPRDARDNEIGWDRCQPIGASAWDQGASGIACRSAAARSGGGEELAWFQRDSELQPTRVQPFEEWFWDPIST